MGEKFIPRFVNLEDENNNGANIDSDHARFIDLPLIDSDIEGLGDFDKFKTMSIDEYRESGLTSAEDLDLPTDLEGKGDLNLGALQSAEGLELPNNAPDKKLEDKE